MSHIEWLRSRVGHDPILLVYATAVISDGKGDLLLQRRSDLPAWGLPGGLLEPGETIREALVRETLEETGFLVEPIRFIGLYTAPDYTVRYTNGDIAQQVTACLACDIVEGDGEPNGREALEQRFCPRGNIPALFPWYAQMLRDAERQRGTRFDAGSARGKNPYPEGIIRRLRALVGSAPIVVPCASAVVCDARGRVLLVRRGDSGLWALPSGAMEIGERIDQTAIREAREETGLRVRPRRLTGFHAGPEHHAVYPNGDEAWLAVATFLCEVEGGGLRPDGEETLDAGFFDIDAMPLDHEPWGARTRLRIEEALSGSPDAVFC